MWVNGALRHSVFFIGFLGAAFATHAGKHIRVDAVTRNLGGRVRMCVRLVTTLLPLVVCAVCILKGWQFHEAEQPDIAQLDEVIDSKVGSLAIPFGFGLIFVHMLVHLAVDASWVASGKEPPPESHGEGVDLIDEAKS
jgi:TRAP-type C4-dicarboxylate transport system permease small subunit